ncbi:hypothetical protein FV222_00320 [Methylobacterium sp. WL103]|uniref:hypothetical protein n=1 Tax=Methylobacterium sp. WL103 TaxID=2603891 RepID=UPI0011C8308C|nr:hypothetical protein [Methylobacterium sp. WL103]TXN08949.1 hypothetical protein FV222_00320 [Methylobacterium sp. WL103]
MSNTGINGGLDLNGVTDGVDLDLMLADLDVSDDDATIEAVTDVEREEVVEEPEVEETVVNEDNEDEVAQAMTDVEEAGATEEAAEAAVEEPAIVVTDAEASSEVEAEAAAQDEHDEDVTDALAAEIDMEEQRDAIYAEQPADDTSLDASAPPAAAPKKARAVSTGVPRARTAVADLHEDNFVLTTDIPADLAANKAAVLTACPAQKKVREKFENLLVSVAGNRAPSTYTVICFKALMASGEVTGAELTGALKSSGLGEGTARSQSGQLMALFPAVKIATPAGNKLTVNPDSLLVAALKGILSIA